MANQVFQFVVRKGPKPGQIYQLTEEAIAVGRDPVSDIVIIDPEISRHHARLSVAEDGYILQDLASTNGTFVDGKRLGGEPYPLRPDQVVMFGSNVILVFQAVPGPDPMATVVAPASVSYADEVIPEEPVVEPAVPQLPEVEEEEVAEVEIPEEPVIAEVLEVDDEEVVEVVVPEELEADEVEDAAAVAVVELLEEDDVVIEVDVPESPVPDEAVDIEIAVPLVPEREEEVVPEPVEDEIGEDEDLPTIIDEVVVLDAALPEPEPEVVEELPEAFPVFDDVEEEPEPVVMSYEEPEPVPEPVQEMPVYKDPEPVLAAMPDPTVPDVDFQPPAATPPSEEEKKGGVNRTLLIAILVFVVLCCCILGATALIVTFTTEFVDNLVNDLGLTGVWFFRGLSFLMK